MRSRRWISWIAIAGMLLHAATIARHNVILFQQSIPAELAASFGIEPGVTCDASGEAPNGGKAGKGSGGGVTHCPICLGLASAHAMPASEAPVLRIPQTVIALAFVPHNRAPFWPAAVRLPSNRGPPSIA